jgi:hypothetical protein
MRERHGLRVEAAVRHGASREAELEHLVPAAGRQDPISRAAAVDLLEAVLEADARRVAEALGDLGEVDDDLDAFRDREPVARHLDRARQQVAVVGDHPERDALAEVVRVREEELVEARRACVEQAEAVPALGHLEERLDLAVRQERVADQAVVLEGVERDEPGRRVDQLVREDERDVELREPRQMEAGGLVARVEVVEQDRRPDEALVRVLGGVVDPVVVVPEEPERLLHVAIRRVRGVPSGELQVVEVVVVLAAEEEPLLHRVARAAVAVGARVEVVQVR